MSFADKFQIANKLKELINPRTEDGHGSDPQTPTYVDIVDATGVTINVDGVDVNNFPDNYPLPQGQVDTLTPQTDALTETQLRTVVPDTAGTWSYFSGVDGTVNVTGRVLQITATSGPLSTGTITIDGGQTITVPPNKAITIEPRGNLSAPTIVFTSTQAYFIEVVA